MDGSIARADVGDQHDIVGNVRKVTPAEAAGSTPRLFAYEQPRLNSVLVAWRAGYQRFQTLANPREQRRRRDGLVRS